MMAIPARVAAADALALVRQLRADSDPTKNQAIPSDASRQAPTLLAIAHPKGMLIRTALSFGLAPVF
jgi:hypothetical protein